MEKLKLKSKTKQDVIFSIEVENVIKFHNTYQHFTLIETKKRVLFEEKQGKRCMRIGSHNVDASVINYVKNSFGVQVKKGDLYFQITDESWNDIQETILKFNKEVSEFKTEKQKRIDALPIRYYLHDSMDWGDYTSDKIQAIVVMRDQLEEETHGTKHGIIVKSYYLNNSDIKEIRQEWDVDYINSGGSVNDSLYHQISNELAEKWIGNWLKVQNQKAAIEAEKRAKAEAAQKAEKQRREDCFAKAKETNQPVQLYSGFLSGDDIPKRFRDDDSDMGNLISYAMPDGSVTEKFIHAY